MIDITKLSQEEIRQWQQDSRDAIATFFTAEQAEKRPLFGYSRRDNPFRDRSKT